MTDANTELSTYEGQQHLANRLNSLGARLKDKADDLEKYIESLSPNDYHGTLTLDVREIGFFLTSIAADISKELDEFDEEHGRPDGVDG